MFWLLWLIVCVKFFVLIVMFIEWVLLLIVIEFIFVGVIVLIMNCVGLLF